MFNNARLKLTAWYLLIIMCVSITFSFVIYKALTREVARFANVQRIRIERELYGVTIYGQPLPHHSVSIDADLTAETQRRIVIFLVIINASIFVISGGLGYLLAGKTLKPIQEMVEEQNRFISDASHELRTPLTSMKTALEVALRNKALTLEETKGLLRENITDVNKLQSLSEELLQLAQFQKPNSFVTMSIVSLSAVIKEAIRRVEPMAKQKQISITTRVKDHTLKGEKFELTDLFVILLDNAIKYSPKNKHIDIFAERTDGMVKVSVRDQGIGMNQEDVPHIFDRFFRADSARSKSVASGYGLGLSIAKKIIDLHHGSISVESTLKKGTTFTVILPVSS